jgi:acetylornithine/N-succinyldiaminopimelate aminotransferase
MGLMIGIEMETSVAQLRDDLLFKDRIFTGVAGSNIIRLLPSLTLSISEADRFLEAFRARL